ncbi:MAG: 30S ribosomal protein S2 [candidate division CPR2 bacterium GW2011_GWC1_39_9]|uniref:Small ribosomal subunit protein uS2 n=1 Tax=candidate division CPR2 bacterium GW2011_GWC2_39_10 TaxID=1618345 RepID=A0A0G0PAW5_UNCC2|nr:MAG: 30S ribosomal protein S2 [candidate division CPR2 bacterium GW2011_GWC2_39_10]KKR33188.1 MAG: 30S ribosomal protein S2 [candidate division CPR2 bacterium GW2011_GWC1_39_9]
MVETSLKDMLEAGVHFGHQAFRWNPKMSPYIYTERNGVHIFDLTKTKTDLDAALKAAQEFANEGKIILFVGTKKQAKSIVEEAANNCNMPYINNRWLGGLMTNFQTISKRIGRLKELERQKIDGEFDQLSKKDRAAKEKELEKLSGYLGGIKDLKKVPDAVFIIDTHREDLAVKEAKKLNLPVFGIVDTNADPDPIDFPIPGNDDAVKAIQYLAGAFADAIKEGSAAAIKEEVS